ncbi:MAG: hypothetical protein ACI9XO_003748 [Paraglaciecola sp.]|jgi:hypothetical protein
MKQITISFLLFFSISIEAQIRYDYNWLSGYNTINDTTSKGNLIDFNIQPASTELLEIPLKIFLSNATISDNNGDLLFYTNGCAIANKNHEIMPNSEGLNPGAVSNSNCEYGYLGSQSCLILPIPESASKYYLFHKAFTYDPNLTIFPDKLYYTLIDMSLDEGLGEVVDKNVILRDDTIRSGEMTAIKHSNGEDWWLINGSYDSDEFFTFLITADSIEGPFFQNIGFVNTRAGSGSGQVVFSPDGTKFARINKDDQLYLYDFDRETGLFSNFEQIIVDDTVPIGGCAISSNSQFLYISTGNKLFQFDLEATDIKASQVLIDEYDGWGDPFPANFYQMQLAPDCRIFMNSTNGVAVLHVINQPNEKGVDCDFQQHSFPLPSYNQASLPHFPYYRMDTDYPICDSSLVVSSTEVIQRPQKKEIQVYPNPASDQIMVDFGQSILENGQFKIYNIMGQEMVSYAIDNGSERQVLSLEQIPNGIYILKLKESNLPPQTITIKVVK